MLKDKGLIIGIIVTLVIIVGGVIFFSKSATSTNIEPVKVSDNILLPENTYKTSGLKDGKYMESTPSAKVTLVEFGDFQCPACGIYHEFVKQLMQDYAGKVNLAFRNFPLTQHKNAPISSQAAEAAGLQGKYWEMHDKLFESQKEWSDSGNPLDIFVGYAQSLGLNTEQFKNDINAQVIKNKIQTDTNDANLIKINQTPTFFINGKKIDNLPGNYEGFKSLIEKELSG